MGGCCAPVGEGEPVTVNRTLDLEKEILGLVGMQEKKDYFIFNQQVPKHNGWIHTIEAGMGNKQQLVLVHGYGATGAFYYKMIEELRHYFHVYAIDMFGFGQSARPTIQFQDYEQGCKFFVDPIEEWRIHLGIRDFVLVAHSLGAYLMTQYMRIWRPPVKMLYLISPAGFTLRSVEEIKARMAKYVSGVKLLTLKLGFYVMENMKISPLHLSFLNREQAIEKYFNHERMRLSPEEIKLFKEYYLSILEMPPSGEKALGTFLFYGSYSKKPIWETLKKLKDDICNVRVFYGDADWMDTEHSIEVNTKEDLKIDIQIVPNCGHQIMLQNPGYLNEVMVKDLKSDYDANKYFEEQFTESPRQSYMKTNKKVLEYMSKNATDLTMLNDSF